MRRAVVVTLVALFVANAANAANALAPTPAELARWQARAARVSITRDTWGVAHVHGRSDADAVFGMEYAQAEDDFARVEWNYVVALGRRAEAEGESAVFADLRQRLFVCDDSLRAQYRRSPASLRALMDAFADGLNFYLYRHPSVTPRVIARFEPWMALSFTEGSIGGNIERVSVPELAAFYGDSALAPRRRRGDGEGALAEPSGSNGFAIAPARTARGHALLWINPHTSYYFRSELQMTSDEGLNAYGAVTWGQFFVYQGFNAHCGWMHTSSGVDNIDEFAETITRRGDAFFQRRGARDVPVRERVVRVRHRSGDTLATRTFRAYFTTHGPVVRRVGDRWIAVSLMNKPIEALTQSYERTKARGLAEFRALMALHANSSNNTVFADDAGRVAYFHSNYIPRRDTTLDWNVPVDGSRSEYDYRGLLRVEESPNAVNPASGWVQNCNDWPWSSAGESSPRREAFPRMVETATEESPRGEHAVRLLAAKRDWTVESLAAAAFDPALPAFERMLPRLLAAYDATAPGAPERARFAAPIDTLRTWDRRWSATSVATTLAVHWGEAIVRAVARDAAAAHVTPITWAVTRATDAQLLGALGAASDTLTSLYGDWRTPWGEVNRFQRLDAAIEPHFDDAKPSLAIPFASGTWGSLASAGSRQWPGTRRRYSTSGNSFLAAVEFGDTLRATAVTAGGASGDPASPHFTDQAERFVAGLLREVWFHPWQLTAHTERKYRPGE
ncbi:MAG: penicillin acylase family protein [Candidatus Eisenbacteria bacterium]|uniref:Penicillin acylase family protein n=1 Tax=Eiseniibacteriota bacterium TaxID=2212470 RepID=A0A933SEE6_UNCEI|nr:penicillin acylase family protein [Candidatus Eisenbacteria bacterium]